MTSKAVATYNALRTDFDILLSLHSGSGAPGRPPGNNEPLLRAAVVLLVTAWENYVEQAVSEAFAHVMQCIGDAPTLLAPHLQVVIQRSARDDAWSVVGDGWRAVAIQEVNVLTAELNNAAPGQVDGLVWKALGHKDFLDDISWRNKRAQTVRDDLKSLVNDVRGEIVHKGRTPSALNLQGLIEWEGFVKRLVERCDTQLAAVVARAYGSPPW